MKHPIFVCVVSAIVGALAATAFHQLGPRRQVTAQEPLLRQPGARALELPPSPAVTRRSPSVTTDAGGSYTFASSLEEFAPEERTNILVYDKTNRSVVHITTKANQRELLFLEVPAEGAGSGSILDKQGHILTN